MAINWRENQIIIGVFIILAYFFEILSLPFLIVFSVISRYRTRPIDVGLGPEPLINNIYHKMSLLRSGYSAETFVTHVYFITEEFDVRYDRYAQNGTIVRRALYHFLGPMIVFTHAIFRYQSLYLYFNGGCLYNTRFLWRLEPRLYHLARVRTIVMPYGGDVQDLTRCPNLVFRHTMSVSYPGYRLVRRRVTEKIDLWTCLADHVISGCDWVDYMYHWDTLTLGHFSIDTDRWQPQTETQSRTDGVIRILHAPNHREIKGSRFFIQAVEELQAEGLPIELQILERVPNHVIRKAIEDADIVADQLIIGWYAMFALEAMSLEKPVLCNIRADLEDLYITTGLLEEDELPFIRCTPITIKEVIRNLVEHHEQIPEIGRRSRSFVERHHSTRHVGEVFDGINRKIGLTPSIEVSERMG